jgi:thioredoxin 1
MSIVHLTDGNFEKEVLKSKIPVLIDFWAQWCMPCKAIAPILDEIVKKYHGKLKVAKLNIDEGQDTATKYGIMSIPTLMFFKDGVVCDQVVGALSKEQLIKKIQDNL